VTAGRALLRCHGLRIGYGRRPLLPAIDLDLRAGELLLVVGHNGSGKSTLLRTILGLVPPLGGRVEASEPAPRLAYVPQAAALDNVVPVRVRDVVGWGRLRGWSFLWPFGRSGERGAVDKALAEAGAGALGRRRFRELSGGQQQRTLLARVLASEADLVVLDEPTAALDAKSERAAYARLAGLAHDRGLAVVVVTHALDAAAGFADRMLFVEPPGTVVCGPPREVTGHAAFRQLFGDVHLGSADAAAALAEEPQEDGEGEAAARPAERTAALAVETPPERPVSRTKEVSRGT
jgi:manganese/iron transport system ATP-binding protein